VRGVGEVGDRKENIIFASKGFYLSIQVMVIWKKPVKIVKHSKTFITIFLKE
jgi:hypothetical protein